ncbi:hypothetical protein GGG16DRAFT_54354, partial [Schizophyllum commune]
KNADGLHECTICGKGFQRPSGLSTHMNIHNKLKPYACGHEDCDAHFAARSNARRHRHQHGADFVRAMDASERAAGSVSEPTFIAPIVADSRPCDEVVNVARSSSEVVRWMPVNLAKRHHRPPKRTSRRTEKV